MLEKLENIRPVGNRERIPFKCTSCGACCRDVRDSIMLEPFDTYRLIRHFKRGDSCSGSPEEILDGIAELKPLSRGYWVYVLKTVNDSGVCLFLKDNKCRVYASRPRTCRTYPFAVETYENSPELKWLLCTEKPHHFRGGLITPREWQRRSFSKEEVTFLLEEAKTLPEIGRLIAQIPDSLLDKAEAMALSFTYFAYDFNMPFLTQYRENMSMLKAYLKNMTVNTVE